MYKQRENPTERDVIYIHNFNANVELKSRRKAVTAPTPALLLILTLFFFFFWFGKRFLHLHSNTYLSVYTNRQNTLNLGARERDSLVSTST